MTESIMGIIPGPHHQAAEAIQVPPEALGPGNVKHVADPVHQRAVDMVFAHHRDETAGAALAMLWASSMLLADLAQEHLKSPVDEDEERATGEHPRLPSEPT